MKTLTTVVAAVGLLLVACGMAQAALVVADDLLVNLDAQGLTPGQMLTDWTNQGSVVGDFSPNGDPMVEDVDDGATTARAMTFDGDDWFGGPISPDGVEGAGTRSIEAWVYNPDIADEEAVVAWGHRGGPDGSNMSFNYGNSNLWGSVGHWGGGTHDMGWWGGHAPAPAAGNWWHLAYTYDGTSAQVYVNGFLESVRSPIALNTHVDVPIKIGTQNADAVGNPAGLGLSGSVAQVRIHDGALSSDQVLYNYVQGITATAGDVPMLTSRQDGDWNDDVDPRTWDSTVPAVLIPNADSYAVIDGHNITLQSPPAAAGQAFKLDIINDGSLAVSASQALNVKILNVEGGAKASALTLGDGATLSAHSGSVGALTAGTGNAVIDILSGGALDVASYTAGGTGTLTKQGGGMLTLDAVTAPQASGFTVDAGMLKASGAKPLGDSETLTLNGGTASFADEIGAPGTVPPSAPTGPYAHWKLDETSGATTAADSAGVPPHDGTLVDMDPLTSWVPGKINNSLAFDGANDKVDVGNLGKDMDEASISVWVHPNTSDWRSIFHTKAWAAGDLHFIVVDGRILFACNGMWHQSGGNTNDLWSNSTIPYNEWSNVVATYNRNTDRVQIYINGELDQETVFQGENDIKFTNGLFMGSDAGGGGRWLNGQLDELMIYDRVLTPAEVSTIAGQKTPPDMSNTNVFVTANSTLNSDSSSKLSFGPVQLQSGVSLATTGGDLSFQSLSIAGGAGRSGTIAPENVLDIGIYNDGGTAATLVKGGSATLTLDSSKLTAAQTTFEVANGTLETSGANPLGGSTALKLSGGTFSFFDVGVSVGDGPADRKIAHWAFEEAPRSGNTTADETGNYDGTLIGGADFSPAGASGNALISDGTGFVDLPDGFADFTNGISVAAWVKTQEFTNWARVIDFGNGPAVDNILLARIGTDDDLRWEVWGGIAPGDAALSPADVYKLDEWQHLVATIDNDAPHTAKVYLDGVEIASGAMTLPGNVTRKFNYIGNSNWNDAIFRGLMDEIYIYDRALTQGEVTQMATRSATPPDFSAVDVTAAPGTSSTLRSQSQSTVTFKSLTMMDGARLTTTGSGVIKFDDPTKANDTIIDSAASVVGFNPEAATDFGVIDGSGSGAIVSKFGPASTMALSTPNTGLEGATFRVEEGTLKMVGSDPWGGSTAMSLAGGTFEVVGLSLPSTPESPYAHWPLDETDGTTAHDSVGTNHGTLIDMDPATDWVPGRVGNALDFDGINDKVSVNNLGTDISEMSVSVWVNRRTNQFDSIFHTKQWTPGDLHFIVTDRILFACNGMGQQSGGGTNDFWSNGTIPANEWTNVIATYSLADHMVKIFLDGRLDRETSFTGNNPIKFTNGFYMASNNAGNGRWFDGQLDDLVIFDRILAQEEIWQLNGAQPLDLTTHTVEVSGPATLRASSATRADLGPLTMQEGGILTTEGAPITFNAFAEKAADTTIAAGAQAVGFDPQTATDVGLLDGNHAGATITKYGGGALVLDEANVNLAGSVFDAQGGQLVGVPAQLPDKAEANPFGEATLQINGGEIVLAGRTTDGAATYQSDVVGVADGILTAGSGGNGTTGVAVSVAGGGKSVTVNDAVTVALRSQDGYSLNLAGDLGGPGGVEVTEGIVSTTNVDVGAVTVSGGQLSTPLGATVGDMLVTGGEMNTSANVSVQTMKQTGGQLGLDENVVRVHEKLTIAGTEFNISDTDTFDAAGDQTGNMIDGANLRLNVADSTLTIGGAARLMVAGELLVNADTQDLTSGSPVPTWTNKGTLGGVFTATGDPTAVVVTDGNISATGVEFTGNDWFEGPLSVPGIESEDARSIEAWVYNPALADEETVVSWSHRGATARNNSYGYGSNDGYGAAGHWGGANDMGWGNPEPAAGQWHHLAWTYDGDGTGAGMMRVYSDGVEFNAKDFGDVLNSFPGRSINIGAQRANDVPETLGANTATMTMAVIRIHDGLLSADDVLYNYNQGVVVDLETPVVVDLPTANVVVTANVELESFSDSVKLGNLTIEDGVEQLTLSSAPFNFADVTTPEQTRIAGDMVVRGNLHVGGSPGTLNMLGGFELVADDPATPEDEGNAIYHCEIGSSDPASIVYPDDGRPYYDPSGYINDRVKVTGADAYLDGELKLPVLSKLGPRFALDPDEDPPTMVEWYGFQTRTIVEMVTEESTVREQFATVPQPQPEEWRLPQGNPDDPDFDPGNWEEGHLGYGVFLTRLGTTPEQPGMGYYPYATRVNLFQAASGDTNGDRLLDSRDVQYILGFGEYLTGEPATWPQGDFNGSDDPEDPDLPPGAGPSIGLCDSYDIQLILATALWPPTDPPTPYAEPPGGKPAEGQVKLLVVPGEDGTFSLRIDTDGLPINSYAVRSADGALSGEDAANLGLFTEDDDFVIAGAGLDRLLEGVYDLGAVAGPGLDGLDGLSLTYTVQGAAGLYQGQVVMIPEPGTVAMLIAGGLGLLLLAVRRRRTA